MRFWVLLALLSLPDIAASQEFQAPESVKARVGRSTEFRVSVPPGVKFGWARGWSSDGCRAIRLHSDDPAEAIFEVTPYERGDWVMVFWKHDLKSHRVKVDVVDAPAPPVPPTPPVPPDPKPPTPPAPPVPPPQSELAKNFQIAYGSDATPAALKRGYLLGLAGFYSGVAESEWLAKNEIGTIADMLSYLREERKKFCPEDALVPVRKVVSDFLLTSFGEDPSTKVDAALRERAKVVFATVSKALTEVR